MSDWRREITLKYLLLLCVVLRYPWHERSELFRCLSYSFMCGDDDAAIVVRWQLGNLTESPGCSPRWRVASRVATRLRLLLIDTTIVDKAEEEARLVEWVEIVRKVTDQ